MVCCPHESSLLEPTHENCNHRTQFFFALGIALAVVVVNLTLVGRVSAAGNEKVLYSFSGGTDGANPTAGLVRDTAGNLYGITDGVYDGRSDVGTVFKLDSDGTETVLHVFTGDPDGAHPYGGMVEDAAGNLYGTTRFGGNFKRGTVFKVDLAGNETILYSFTGGIDGANPTGGLLLDPEGNLYGTTTEYGTSGLGNVFKLDTTGTQTVLHSFTGPDGNYPNAFLIRDSAGNLYGTTINGGVSGFGTVFKLNAKGTFQVLYSFAGGTDGAYPNGGLVRDAAGNLYGTTVMGGTLQDAGTVFKLDTTGTKTVLYSFLGGVDGGFPVRSLLRDSAGNLYGTASVGGASGLGTVFKLALTGKETVLYSFAAGADGVEPYTDLIRDPAGNLYGTTVYGGTGNLGTVFEISKP